MNTDADVLNFIKQCIKTRNIYWTYHINMRLRERFISRELILNAIDSYEIIEEYPEDKYLPSYLIYAKSGNVIFHIHFAIDRLHDNIRMVTAYKPSFDKWEIGLKIRRK